MADSAFEPKIPLPVLTSNLILTSVEFNQRFKKSPIKRAKRRGYLRNLSVAIGNTGNKNDIPILEQAMQDDELLIRKNAEWAKEKLERGSKPALRKTTMKKLLIATNNKGKVTELQDLYLGFTKEQEK